VDKLIDLRSDTVTVPGPAMRQAMANAEVGDDVFEEDPTVRALQDEVADLLGKEAALFTPSGCMANQIALNIHAGEGDEVVVEYDSHIFNYETTGAAFISRVQLHPVKAAKHGLLTATEVATAFREKAYYMPVTRLVALENTHNRAGGTVYPVEQIAEIARSARASGVIMHLDGARLWNACAFSGLAPKDYAKHFETVAVCFSKGLGAPVGSAITGPKELIEKTRRTRKILGGGMRQVGILAAGALYALRNNRDRMSEDHVKARTFAEIISSSARNVEIDMSRVQTNIVLLKLAPSIDLDHAIARMKERGVRLSKGASGLLRAIAHLDVTLNECERAAHLIVKEFG
jgi:threonine aldolase